MTKGMYQGIFHIRPQRLWSRIWLIGGGKFPAQEGAIKRILKEQGLTGKQKNIRKGGKTPGEIIKEVRPDMSP